MSEDLPEPPSKLDLERHRVPLERKISLKFKEFRGFITEYSENISLGGMFIRTSAPKPPGTIFDFELSLTDDFKLVQGIGEVVWIRQTDEGSERPSGMGVRFLDLSPESRKLIQRMVDEHVARGGRPFELEPQGFPPPPVRARAAAASPARPASPAMFHPTAAPVAPLPARERAPSPPSVGADAPAPEPPPPQQALLPLEEEPVTFAELEPLDLPMPELDLGEGGDALPSVDSSWEKEESIEGFPVEEEDEAAAMGAAEPRAPEEEAPAGEPTPLDERHEEPVNTWMSAAAPSPSPRRRQHDAALDEVARAFGEAPLAPPGPSTSEMTARLPVAPAASVASAARPVNVVTERDEEPAPPPRQVLSYRPLNAPRAEREPRRSRALPIVLVLLLLLVGAAAVLYFFYPALLPEWARPPGSSAVAARPATSSPGTAPASAAAAPAAGPATAPAAAPAASADTSAATSLVAATSPALLPTAAAAAPSASAPAVGPPPVASAPPVAAAPLPAPAAPLPRAVAPSAPGAHFTAIEEIWGQRTGAGTVVTIVGNGPVPPDAFSHFRLEGDNPREVVRVRGVDGSFKRTLIAVGTTEVKEIRVGFHGQGGQGELHVVLDLASPRVKLVRLSATDNRIEIQLAQ